VLATKETPEVSRNERLWGHPGLTPVGAPPPKASPLMAYRWEHTDAALTAQVELEREGHPGVVEPGHAVVRFTNPATAGDCLSTMRCQSLRSAAFVRYSWTKTILPYNCG
jgi:gentisate 1,2-dioxygenase